MKKRQQETSSHSDWHKEKKKETANMEERVHDTFDVLFESSALCWRGGEKRRRKNCSHFPCWVSFFFVSRLMSLSNSVWERGDCFSCFSTPLQPPSRSWSPLSEIYRAAFFFLLCLSLQLLLVQVPSLLSLALLLFMTMPAEAKESSISGSPLCL